MICFSSSCNLSVRLAPTATLIPVFDNASEIAYPIPLLAPVTIATSLFSNVLITCQYDLSKCVYFSKSVRDTACLLIQIPQSLSLPLQYIMCYSEFWRYSYYMSTTIAATANRKQIRCKNVESVKVGFPNHLIC